MREITMTETILMPTDEEISASVKEKSPIPPQQVTLVTCFIEGFNYCTEEQKAVYKCMKMANKFYRASIASEVVTAYCNKAGIKWGTIRVIQISEYKEHFVIEAMATTR